LRHVKTDVGGAPAEPIDLALLQRKGGEGCKEDSESAAAALLKMQDRVVASTGCQDRDLLRHALQEAAGDFDEAVELVIAEMATGSAAPHNKEANQQTPTDGASMQLQQNGPRKQSAGVAQVTSTSAPAATSEPSNRRSSSQGRPKKAGAGGKTAVGRNRMCPCDSKQKYKNCCGTAQALAAAEQRESEQLSAPKDPAVRMIQSLSI